MRLNKYLADVGVASRRAADRLIAAGLVKVNGKVVQAMGIQVNPDKDKIEVDGKAKKLDKKLVYILLNKPKGVVSACKPTREEPYTVLDLIDRKERLFPIGRLDKDTTGLLILTNDGDLALRLTHPSFESEKEYEALLDGEITLGAIQKLEAGVILDGKRTSPLKIHRLRPNLIRLVLHEGKNRQVRRMCQKVGCLVLELKRIRVKGLTLGSLPLGKWRHLTPGEIDQLKK